MSDKVETARQKAANYLMRVRVEGQKVVGCTYYPRP